MEKILPPDARNKFILVLQQYVIQQRYDAQYVSVIDWFLAGALIRWLIVEMVVRNK